MCSVNKVIRLAEVLGNVVPRDIVHGNAKVCERIAVNVTRVKSVLIHVFRCHIQDPCDSTLLQSLNVSAVLEIAQE